METTFYSSGQDTTRMFPVIQELVPFGYLFFTFVRHPYNHMIIFKAKFWIKVIYEVNNILFI